MFYLCSCGQSVSRPSPRPSLTAGLSAGILLEISCSLHQYSPTTLTDIMIKLILCLSSLLITLASSKLSALIVSSTFPSNIFTIRCWTDSQGIVLEDSDRILAEFKVCWPIIQFQFQFNFNSICQTSKREI